MDIIQWFLSTNVGIAILGSLGASIIILFFTSVGNRVKAKARDLLIGERLEELPRKREAKVILIADGIVPLLDSLKKHETMLATSRTDADIQPFPEVSLVELDEPSKNDLAKDSPEISEKLTEYNQQVTQYQETRQELMNSLRSYLEGTRDHLFRNISMIKNENHAGYYAQTILDVRLPKRRHGGMDTNWDIIQWLVFGIRNDERFIENFNELEPLADNILESNEELQDILEDVRDKYTPIYNIDDTEVKQIRNNG